MYLPQLVQLLLLATEAASTAPIKSATPRKRAAPKKTINEKSMEPNGSDLKDKGSKSTSQ